MTIPLEIVQNKIYLIRGHKVMIDKDLAGLYEIPTKSLKFQFETSKKRPWRAQVCAVCLYPNVAYKKTKIGYIIDP